MNVHLEERLERSFKLVKVRSMAIYQLHYLDNIKSLFITIIYICINYRNPKKKKKKKFIS